MACMSLIKKPVVTPTPATPRAHTPLVSPCKHCLVWKAGNRTNHQITQTCFELNWGKYNDLQQTLSLWTHHSPTKTERFSHLSTIITVLGNLPAGNRVFSLIQIHSLLFLAHSKEDAKSGLKHPTMFLGWYTLFYGSGLCQRAAKSCSSRKLWIIRLSLMALDAL